MSSAYDSNLCTHPTLATKSLCSYLLRWNIHSSTLPWGLKGHRGCCLQLPGTCNVTLPWLLSPFSENLAQTSLCTLLELYPRAIPGLHDPQPCCVPQDRSSHPTFHSLPFCYISYLLLHLIFLKWEVSPKTCFQSLEYTPPQHSPHGSRYFRQMLPPVVI